jgi:hypothetical protein
MGAAQPLAQPSAQPHVSQQLSQQDFLHLWQPKMSNRQRWHFLWQHFFLQHESQAGWQPQAGSQAASQPQAAGAAQAGSQAASQPPHVSQQLFLQHFLRQQPNK